MLLTIYKNKRHLPFQGIAVERKVSCHLSRGSQLAYLAHKPKLILMFANDCLAIQIYMCVNEDCMSTHCEQALEIRHSTLSLPLPALNTVHRGINYWWSSCQIQEIKMV